MIPFHIILLAEQTSSSETTLLSPTHQTQQLWSTIETAIVNMHYHYETVTLDRLDDQDQEAIEKVLNADLVIMVGCPIE
jgi:hypothetical protein